MLFLLFPSTYLFHKGHTQLRSHGNEKAIVEKMSQLLSPCYKDFPKVTTSGTMEATGNGGSYWQWREDGSVAQFQVFQQVFNIVIEEVRSKYVHT